MVDQRKWSSDHDGHWQLEWFLPSRLTYNKWAWSLPSTVAIISLWPSTKTIHAAVEKLLTANLIVLLILECTSILLLMSWLSNTSCYPKLGGWTMPICTSFSWCLDIDNHRHLTRHRIWDVRGNCGSVIKILRLGRSSQPLHQEFHGHIPAAK